MTIQKTWGMFLSARMRKHIHIAVQNTYKLLEKIFDEEL